RAPERLAVAPHLRRLACAPVAAAAEGSAIAGDVGVFGLVSRDDGPWSADIEVDWLLQVPAGAGFKGVGRLLVGPLAAADATPPEALHRPGFQTAGTTTA